MNKIKSQQYGFIEKYKNDKLSKRFRVIYFIAIWSVLMHDKNMGIQGAYNPFKTKMVRSSLG